MQIPIQKLSLILRWLIGLCLLHLLRQIVDRGTGRAVRRTGFAHPAAGKTGTTNDNTDAWFVGVSPNLAAGVWGGFDQRRQHKLVDTQGKQITGGSGAAPIWAKFMREAHENRSAAYFQKPRGLHIVKIDPHSGTAPPADSLATVRPISVALRRDEDANTPDEVLDFEEQRRRALIDSTAGAMWQDTTSNRLRDDRSTLD